MATIVDVAKRAGVSISTVSYVLSAVRPVSERTKRRVFEAMEALNYRPHAHAQALASKKSHILALLFPPTGRGLGESELEFVMYAVEAAREHGYNLVLWTCEHDDRRELSRLIRQGLVDGMILMEVHENDPRIEQLKQAELPFSMIGRSGPPGETDWVDVDFERTFHDAVSYLASLGHRRIGFINQSREVYESGYGAVCRSQEGFERAMVEAGLVPVSRFCPALPKDGWTALDSLFDQGEGITALITMNDRALPGILQGIAARGLRVGGDLSVLPVVTSARSASMYLPALSTFETPTRELARRGVELLIQRLAGMVPRNESPLFTCQLVVRASTASVPV